MAGAAGGFITRSFESMLKESKKYGALQKAIQAYLDCTKEDNNQFLSASAGQSKVTSLPTSERVSAGFEIVEERKDLHNRTSVSTPEDEEVVNIESLGTSKSIMTALASAGNTLEGAQSEIVLQPLRLAFETENTKLVELALDCLHKLIAYDHLEGDPGLEDGKNARLLTDILNMVCNCKDNSSSDSTALQVLKVLLTVVASAKFRVHGEPLLGVIKVCYSISMKSKSPINQATSKATLTQMISIIFRRMESDKASSLSSSLDSNPLHVDAISPNNGERTIDEQDPDMTNQDDPLLMKMEKEKSHAYIEELQNLAVDANIKKLEAVLDKAVNLEDRNKVQSDVDLENLSVGERDALLLFRTLCKMGMKEEKDEVTTRTTNLSLELLQGLLEEISDYFTMNFHFINSVKAYLSYALLRACVSSSSVVFQYAAGIFAVLLLRFRESLKEEIGIFFPLIVLRSLDSSDSSLSQRTSVLRMLEKVSKDSQMLVDIFVNFDCDYEAPNLFERMVDALSRISQLMPNVDPNSVVASQISSIKTSSLQCLVNVMTSLVNWKKFQRECVEFNISTLSVEEELLATESVIDESKIREEVLDHFEKIKDHKSTIEAAVSETVIGEYFGQHEEFPLAVMHAYVDSMKFTGLKFDSAIREFLRDFQLPGEAQKIDHIMEKFAERYCADNPGLLKNADAAYTLAYAVIVLNTDAHNSNVWPKMTNSDFVCMNSMSDGELCAPKELLDEIYDSIVKEEIKMKNDVTDISRSNRQRSDAKERGSLVGILNLSLPRRKTIPETTIKNKDIVNQTQSLFRKKGVKRGTFYSAQQAELVRPMIEAVGWPLLADFSVIMEEGDDKARVLLCMEGFRYGIHITYILGMDTMRYAFLTSLIRSTCLHSPKQLRSKNVEALRTLLALCNTELDCLKDTWNAVLECVSRLDFIISTPFIASSVMQGLNQISRDPVLQSLRELGGKPAERVFVHSVKLPSDSVVEFFTALCGISAEELKQTPARVYSLQKLVEISYYNMARIHLVWARIWSVLSHHFISAGSHYEERISMYAIDSLRQLGMKYLERVELKNFNFQNDILKPFVVLMRNSRSESIRRLIVDCIVQMIKLKVGSIKSGWKSVFMIFTSASNDNLEAIIESVFENVEQVILEHFDQLISDCFMDCVNCLIGFANNKTSSQISLKAIALLRICENRLAEGLIPGAALRSADDGLNSNVDVTEHYWFSMLAGLSELTLDLRVEVRNCALEVLFDLLNERGWRFSSTFWENIFHRVLFPIFDRVRHSEGDIFVSSRDEWLRDTIIHSLQLLCNLFNTFYKEVCFMLSALLSLLLDCAKKTDQSVVSISLGALVHLVEIGGHQFSTDDWDTLLKSIRDASYTTRPLELLKSFEFDNLKDQIEQDAEAHSNRSDGPSINKSHFGSEDIKATFHQASLISDGENFEKANISLMHEHTSETKSNTNFGESEGKAQETAEPADLQMSQTFGQRIIGNIFLRSLTSKSKIQPEDASTSSPLKIPDSVEPSLTHEEEENPSLEAIRSKCITQMLLLDVLNSIQRRYWIRLNPFQKITTMEVILSVLEFASSFNSYKNLRMRMHRIPSGRPPVNLLRQEIKGTAIYLDILQKTTKGNDIQKPKQDENDGSSGISLSVGAFCNEMSVAEQKLKLVAEQKLVSFCEQILNDASELHSLIGDAANVDMHRVLELRSPIIVKVLKGMCSMDSKIFQNHLTEFYPLITKLVCCDQMDVRGALADLFSEQLTLLLP